MGFPVIHFRRFVKTIKINIWHCRHLCQATNPANVTHWRVLSYLEKSSCSCGFHTSYLHHCGPYCLQNTKREKHNFIAVPLFVFDFCLRYKPLLSIFVTNWSNNERAMKFYDFQRPYGKMGSRNYATLIPATDCVHAVAFRILKTIRETKAITRDPV